MIAFVYTSDDQSVYAMTSAFFYYNNYLYFIPKHLSSVVENSTGEVEKSKGRCSRQKKKLEA